MLVPPCGTYFKCFREISTQLLNVYVPFMKELTMTKRSQIGNINSSISSASDPNNLKGMSELYEGSTNLSIYNEDLPREYQEK